MMKCFSKLTYSMAAYVDNLDFAFRIVQRATEYGVGRIFHSRRSWPLPWNSGKPAS